MNDRFLIGLCLLLAVLLGLCLGIFIKTDEEISRSQVRMESKQQVDMDALRRDYEIDMRDQKEFMETNRVYFLKAQTALDKCTQTIESLRSEQ